MTLVSFITTYALIVVTPGLNLAIVMHAGLREGRRSALAAAVGVATGAATLTACIIALSQMMPWFLAGLAEIAPLYGLFLIWMGYGYVRRSYAAPSAGTEPAEASFYRAIMVALTNPFTALFVMTSLSHMEPHMMGPGAPYIVLSVFLVAGLWFTATALSLTSPALSRHHVRMVALLEPMIGLILVALGLFTLRQWLGYLA